MFTHFSEEKNMGKKGKEEKKDSEDHNVHTLLGQPALVQIVDRGLTGKSDQEKKVIIGIIFNLICVNFLKKSNNNLHHEPSISNCIKT